MEIDAVVIGSDMARTGWFSSSNPLLDRLHENVVWGMKGNFVDVPTDCPQRDERLGWTGDLAAFAPTALFLFDCAGLLDGWMDDLAAEQRADGSVPFVVPNVLPGDMTAAAWGDAATLVPDAICSAHGRHQRRHAPPADNESLGRPPGARSATRRPVVWRVPVRRLARPTAPPDEPYRAQADPDVVATAYAIRSAQIAAAVAGAAGDDTRARRAGERAEQALRRSGGSTSPQTDASLSDAPRSTPWRSAGTCFPTRPAHGSSGSPGRPGPRRRVPHLDRVRGHPAGQRRARGQRSPRRRLPAAHADRLSLLALLGDDGGDNGVGTLGQHASRRVDQPGQDDLVQPLRPGCGRGLPAPHRWRACARKSRGTAPSGRSATRRRV